MNKISLIILISIGAMALKKVKKVSFSPSMTSLPFRNKLLVQSRKPNYLGPVSSCKIGMRQISSNSDENTEQRLKEGSWEISFSFCGGMHCDNFLMYCSLSVSSLSFVVDSRLKPHDPMALQPRDFEDIELGIKDTDGLKVSTDQEKCQYTLEYVNLM